MDNKYFEVVYERVKGGCSVTGFSNQEFGWDMSIGKSLKKVWPDDMSFSMNPERPKNVALVDYISNHEGVLLASPKLRDFFHSQELPDVEFLKVTILDHKGRVASDDYCVIHCCRVIDCVDQQKSEFEWDGLDNPSMEMEKMVIDPRTVGADDKVIRPRFVPGITLYRIDLVDAINKGGFSGVAFTRELFGDFEEY